ncbi:unnamed protein product [Withania somnifera]
MAEKLIKQLNLFPKHDINKASPGKPVAATEQTLFEKRFNLSYLGDSGATVQDLGHHAGYYRLPHTKDARMFYFFFESRSSQNDPVVIWLTGGPGCSSELAVFYENGPFNIADNMSLVWNDFGWDKVSNLIYVDQPTGTGFSYTSDDDDIRHDERGVSSDLYDFLQGFAIGNGLTNPEIQYKAYTDYALDMRLIKQSDYNAIDKSYPKCQQAIRLCGTDGGSACMAAYLVCTSIFNKIVNTVGNKNYYDVRKTCDGDLCYDFSNMENLLNDEQVKFALGVGDIEFVSCSSTVYQAMQLDWMRNLEACIPPLLEDGIKVLVYAGEYDLICNWLGNSRWVHAMEWSRQRDFRAARSAPFTVDGEEKGIQKNHGPLTFLRVHDAGHMVPMDQPKAALEMLQRWMQGKLSKEGHFAHM